ncbi:P-loop NTPase family protein [Oecophyllibacter saccharovorans]|uniref:Uncharacterized protein n=1 Tax=Oecophyllibacter saccharovorans TaxID=2558360 RepID=A0A506UM87_9PROT|nr:hypothetical protein [Oecophyllibacter saccharovorans]TPW34293.1 hypothetical protein E3202_07260 [Oecophyllibacter saccharovorans]
MKQPHPLLYRAMPYMVLAFLILSAVQVALLLHGLHPASSPASWKSGLLASGKKAVFGLIDKGRPWYLPLGLLGLGAALAGLVFEKRGDRLAARGLQRRRTVLTRLLERFTRRRHVEAQLLRRQHEKTLQPGELAAALQARVDGHRDICEDVARFLRHRLARQAPLSQVSRGSVMAGATESNAQIRPVAVFLFSGPPHTGKGWFARQLAALLHRPLLTLDLRQAPATPDPADSSDETPFLQQIADALRHNPASVILLDGLTPSESDPLRNPALHFLQRACETGRLTDPRTGEELPAGEAIFILSAVVDRQPTTEPVAETGTPDATEAAGSSRTPAFQQEEVWQKSGLAPALLALVDRAYFFDPLQGRDLAQRLAREAEALVESYGLHLPPGGVDPTLIYRLMEQLGTLTDGKAVLHNLDSLIGDDLILARQQGHDWVELIAAPPRSPSDDDRLFRLQVVPSSLQARRLVTKGV